MAIRNLNLVTDFIVSSDEPVLFPQDNMSSDELNEEIDYLMKKFFRR